MDTVRSIYFWIHTILMTLIVSGPIIICSTILLPFNPHRTWAHAIGNWWGWSIFKINPGWKVTIEGKENLPLPNQAAVLISNHESLSDIIALYLLKTNFKWLAKEELFKIPFFGWSMKFSGYVPLKRGSIKSTRASLVSVKKLLGHGVPILIFPEGTRSLSGELGEFKGGAFKLAIDEQVPIVPIALTGTRDVLQKGSWKVASKIDLKIRILPQLSTRNLTESDEPILKNWARLQIQKALEELKKN